MQRKVLTVQVRVLGAEHPATLTAADNLALVLYRTEEYAEAAKIQREVLTVQMRVLSVEHPGSLVTANNLEDSLCGLGHDAEAKTAVRRSASRGGCIPP